MQPWRITRFPSPKIPFLPIRLTVYVYGLHARKQTRQKVSRTHPLLKSRNSCSKSKKGALDRLRRTIGKSNSIPWSVPLQSDSVPLSIELDDCGCSDDKLLRLTHSQTSPTIQLKLKTANTLARSLAGSCVASVTLNTPLPPSTWNEIKQIWSWKISFSSLSLHQPFIWPEVSRRSCAVVTSTISEPTGCVSV